jgi:hypothetical protein
MRRIVLALALLSGCSFVFVSGPPAHHEQLPYFSCSESRIAPVLDTIFAVLQGANFLLAASVSDERWADNYDGDPPIARSTAIPLYAIGALLGVGGAYYGFSRTAACRDAKELALTRAQRNGPPQAWPPQQPYPPQGTYPPPQGPYAPPQGPYAPPAQGPYAPPAQGPYAPPAQEPYPTAPQGPQAPGAQPPPPPATPPPPPPATPPPPPPNASSR